MRLSLAARGTVIAAAQDTELVPAADDLAAADPAGHGGPRRGAGCCSRP